MVYNIYYTSLQATAAQVSKALQESTATHVKKRTYGVAQWAAFDHQLVG